MRKVNPPLKTGPAGGTALHEARHGTAAELNGTRVLFATVVPGKGYLGLTALSSFDAVAAAAPNAHGDDGTGADVQMIQEAGHSVGGAASSARNILASREAQLMVNAVAFALDRHGTLSGRDIREIIRHVKEGEVLEITVIPPEGNQRKIRHTARHDDTTIDIPVDTRPSPTNARQTAETASNQRRKKIPTSIRTTPSTLSAVTVPPRTRTE